VHRRTAPLGVPRCSAPMHNIGAVVADALLKDTASLPSVTAASLMTINDYHDASYFTCGP